MKGIGPWHIRILCDNTWEGGYGFTPQQVGNFTLDQIFMLFANRKELRKTEKVRTTKLPSIQASQMINSDEDGLVQGRDKDGNPIKGKVYTGKSVARRLMEAKVEREAKEKKESGRMKRSRKREERRRRRASKSS